MDNRATGTSLFGDSEGARPWPLVDSGASTDGKADRMMRRAPLIDLSVSRATGPGSARCLDRVAFAPHASGKPWPLPGLMACRCHFALVSRKLVGGGLDSQT